LTGASPCRFLKLSSLRRAVLSSSDSRIHSLWMWARPDHLTRYSASGGWGGRGGGRSKSRAEAGG
jgi:hypothetical protein